MSEFVVNFDGSRLYFDKPFSRIVSLVPSLTETLYYLGVSESIVGITCYCVKPLSLYKSRTRVGGPKTPNTDLIRALKPDLILCDVEENTRRTYEAVKSMAKVYLTFVRSIEDAKKVVVNLGKLTGAEQRAEAILTIIEQSQQRAKNSPPALAGRKALYLIWKGPYMSISYDTYIFDVLTSCHLEPIVFEKDSRYPVLTDEEIEGSGAEVVFFPDEPYPFSYNDIEKFRQAFSSLPAVRDEALFKIEGANVCWHGYRTTLALDYLHHCLNLP